MRMNERERDDESGKNGTCTMDIWCSVDRTQEAMYVCTMCSYPQQHFNTKPISQCVYMLYGCVYIIYISASEAQTNKQTFEKARGHSHMYMYMCVSLSLSHSLSLFAAIAPPHNHKIFGSNIYVVRVKRKLDIYDNYTPFVRSIVYVSPSSTT